MTKYLRFIQMISYEVTPPNGILCGFIFEVSPVKSVITFSTLRKLE